MIQPYSLFIALLLAPLATLHAADEPKKPQTTAALPAWKAIGEFVMINPACTDITHDSPNPTVLGCGLARMKNGGVMTVYFTPTGAYSKPGASRR
jgi:hypothetical protein